jgi:hypothetical protein
MAAIDYLPHYLRDGKPAQRVYYGKDAAKAADILNQDQDRKEQWPYVHIYTPRNAEPVHVIAFAPTPAALATVEILKYPVPSGYRFYLRAIVQGYVGGAFLPGDATWTIDRNTPIGIPTLQGQPEQGLINVPVQLGSFTASSPWILPRAYEFEELDDVRSKGTNVNLGVGIPNFFMSGFFGYLVPMIGQR